MRVPLHNTQDRQKVIDLHLRMAQMNPKGFRTPTTKTQRRPRKKTRIETMTLEVYGK